MSHVRDHKSAILDAKVGMGKVGQDRHDLILMSERGNERAHGFASPEIMQQLKLILDSEGTTCHVDLFQSNIVRFPSLLRQRTTALVSESPSLRRRTGPVVVLVIFESIPIVLIVVIQ